MLFSRRRKLCQWTKFCVCCVCSVKLCDRGRISRRMFWYVHNFSDRQEKKAQKGGLAEISSSRVTGRLGAPKHRFRRDRALSFELSWQRFLPMCAKPIGLVRGFCYVTTPISRNKSKIKHFSTFECKRSISATIFGRLSSAPSIS